MRQSNKAGLYLILMIGLVFISAACSPGSFSGESTPTPEQYQVQLPAVGAGSDQDAEPQAVESTEAPTQMSPENSQPAGMEYPEPMAKGRVSAEAQTFQRKKVMTTNSGFGGVNSALILEKI